MICVLRTTSMFLASAEGRWLGMQYAFTPNDQLGIDYIGNLGVRIVAQP